MFEKAKLKAKIRKCKKEIAALEQKRVRSQAALVEAILTHQAPKDDDVEFFNKYTAQIETVRQKMHELQQQLKEM